MIGDSFDRLEIEAFSKGSVLVDYYVYFKEVEGAVSTADLKTVLNQQLESSDGTAKLGRFTIDPSYTDFIGEKLIIIIRICLCLRLLSNSVSIIKSMNMRLK